MFTAPRTIQDLLSYRGQSGQLAWVLHRLAGLGTLLFLLIHVVDTSLVYFAPSLYEHAVALYRNPIFGIGEVILVACVVYHAVNGIRITVMDLRPELWVKQAEAQRLVWIGFVVLFGPAAALMLSRIIGHVLGGGV
jgi:succinate dehydrogenase / fumarate reductase cytochrome b subunit